MKKLLILLFCLNAFITSAQKVIVDTTLQKKYNNTYALAYKNLSPHDRLYMDDENKNRPWLSFLISTTYQVDTLNQNDFVVKGRPSAMKTPFLWMFSSLTHGDTLLVADLFGGVFTIISNKHSGSYQTGQLIKVLRPVPILAPSETGLVTIVVKPKFFKLSSMDFTPGNVIYGETEYITEPFYVNDNNSASGRIKKQFHIKYIFKTTAQIFRMIRKD